MNAALPRVHAAEALRFGLIVMLLFFNSVILESNEVIATSGFISKIGVQHVIWLWAADMLIVMGSTVLYSTVIDRTNRARLTMMMFALFGGIYLGLYALFHSGQATWLAYPLLTIINDQQWALFAMLIWALATDSFSTAQAKRLFPLLAMAIMVGSVVGNTSITLLPQFMDLPGYALLLFNASIMFVLSAILGIVHLTLSSDDPLLLAARCAEKQSGVREILAEGMGFIRDVPIFRYLAIAMIPLGFALNAIEFRFLSTIVDGDTASVQTIYGSFKIVLSVTVLLVQAMLTTRLITQIGLRRIFSLVPFAQMVGIVAALLMPIYGIFIGNYLTRVALVAIDEPARQMLFGMAPDERRGRVSAFMNGYLYPLGAISSCLVIGGVFWMERNGIIPIQLRDYFYLAPALLGIAIAFVMMMRIHRDYDVSMLSWRLERRKRRSSIPDLDF